MAPKIIIQMSSQQPQKPTHTKILEVFRSRSAKNNVKDPRQNLFFKIKPQKALSELIVPYRDLRDNFPYALLDYYESKVKIKDQNLNINGLLLIQTEQKVVKSKNKTKPEGKEDLKKIGIRGQKVDQTQKNEAQNTGNKQLILDYDHHLKQIYRPTVKNFHAVFSDSQLIENRYLRDLNNDLTNSYGRKNSSNESNYQNKGKKNKK